MALDKIKTKVGRIAQLEGGTGNNQPARASDVNPIIDLLNGVLGENQQTTTASNTPTINARCGKFTTATLTTAANTGTTITLTNSNITTTSNVLVYVEAYSGTYSTNGVPMVFKVLPNTGSATITLGNISANALNGTVTLKFIVL
jgi:hypothetical protein